MLDLWARRRWWWLPGWLALARWFDRDPDNRWKAAMPLHDYHCPTCDVTFEVLHLRVSHPLPAEVPCETENCPGVAVRQDVAGRIAHTPNQWGTGGEGGRKGVWSDNLQGFYRNERERQALMRRRGAVDQRDLDRHIVADTIERTQQDNAAWDKLTTEYQEAAAVHGEERALDQVLPAHDCLEGTGHAATVLKE